MARQDSLTELPNRRSLLERLTIMVAEAKRYKNNIVVMFVDIDDVKKINDTYGHAAGDFLLQQIAARLNPWLENQIWLHGLVVTNLFLYLPIPYLNRMV